MKKKKQTGKNLGRDVKKNFASFLHKFKLIIIPYYGSESKTERLEGFNPKTDFFFNHKHMQLKRFPLFCVSEKIPVV